MKIEIFQKIKFMTIIKLFSDCACLLNFHHPLPLSHLLKSMNAQKKPKFDIIFLSVCDVIYDKVPQVGNLIFELMSVFESGRFCEHFEKKINQSFEN